MTLITGRLLLPHTPCVYYLDWNWLFLCLDTSILLSAASSPTATTMISLWYRCLSLRSSKISGLTRQLNIIGLLNCFS